MAQKSLNAKIILGGQTTSGFNALESKVEHLGEVVSRVSDKIIDVGKESVQVYKDYELNMATTRAIYEENMGSAAKAAKAMDVLEKKTQEWAATTIFHTDDVSDAVMKAAQAGWTWEEQLEGIPRAMQLAQAGQLDLAQGLTYLARGLDVTKTDFQDSGRFIDQWVKASALANLTIEDLGESLSAMGASATLAGGTAELFTMLDVLANAGSVGSQAGTQLRSAMLRVVAPTKKASEAFAAMGSNTEELEEILEDTGLVEGMEELESLGFSAYKDGKLKDFVTILGDMSKALMKIKDEEKRNAILKDIFPTRNFATAQKLIEAMADGSLPELYEAIMDSEGAAQRRSDAMMDTLYGDLQLLESRWEELERKFGGIAGEQVSSVAGGIGSIIDKLNELPQEQLEALVGGLEGIAILGAGVTFGGAVLKFLGSLGPVGTGILVTAVAVGALTKYLQALDDKNFDGHFGNVQLEIGELLDTMESAKTPFTETKAAIDEIESAVDETQKAYEELTGSLSENTLQAALSGVKLDDTEIDRLQGYGKAIGENVLKGIGKAKARDLTFFDTIFGDWSSQEETDAYVMSLDVIQSWYDDLNAEAYAIGEELRNQMTAALADRTISEQEREAIQATVGRLNEIQRQITNQANQAEYYEELARAQNVSWDSLSEYVQNAEKKYAQKKKDVEDLYYREYGILMAAFDSAIENGTTFEWNGTIRQATEEDRAAALQELDREKDNALGAETSKYGSYMEAAMRTAISTGWGEALNAIDLVRGQAKERGASGALTFEDVDWASILAKGYGENAALQLFDLNKNAGRIKKTFEPFRDYGGVGELLDYLDYAYYLSEEIQGAGMAWDTFRESGGTMDPRNLFSTEAMRAASARYMELPGAIEEAQSKLEGLRGELEHAAEQMDRYAQNGSTANYEIWKEKFNSLRTEAIPEAQAQLAMLQAEFDAFDGEVTVTLPDGKTVAQQFRKDVQENLGSVTLDVYLKQVEGLTGNPLKGYAEGGRATEASVFGDAGAEWAIPEEHSLNTASLLDQTRRASGFTWGELDALSGGGGKNDAAKSVEIHITYSPSVQAQDARGVDAVLKADKERMEKMVRQVLEDVDTEKRASALA